MNEHGLMIGCTQVRNEPRFSGFVRADLIVRMIGIKCSTTTEAVERLRQLLRHANNYSLLPTQMALLRSSSR